MEMFAGFLDVVHETQYIIITVIVTYTVSRIFSICFDAHIKTNEVLESIDTRFSDLNDRLEVLNDSYDQQSGLLVDSLQSLVEQLHGIKQNG